MRIVAWLVRAFLFFTLFAFALNNQQPVTVHWFFGLQWQTPLVFVVLVSFATGAGLGALAMVPSWWRARRSLAPAVAAPQDSQAPPLNSILPLMPEAGAEHPPRLG
jgi:uncharacterized integral membrane protein